MAYKIQHLKLGGILDQAINITKNHFGLLLTILLVLYIPFNLIGGLILLSKLPPPPGIGAPLEVQQAYQQALMQNLPLTMGIGMFSFWVILPLTNAAVVDAVARLYLGQKTSAMESIKYGLTRMLPLVWTTFLATLAIMGGFILLIIPGILFTMWFALSTHVVIIEGISGGAALGRSKQLVRPNMGTMIGLLLLVVVISICIGQGAQLIPQPHIQLVVQQLLGAVITIFSAAAFVVFYFSCRCGVENFDLQYLAESIGVEGDVDEPGEDEDIWADRQS